MKKGNFKAVLMAALVMGFVLACNDKVFASGGYSSVTVSPFWLWDKTSGQSSWVSVGDNDYVRATCTCHEGSCKFRLVSEDEAYEGNWTTVNNNETKEQDFFALFGVTRARVELKSVKRYSSATGRIWVK